MLVLIVRDGLLVQCNLLALKTYIAYSIPT